MIRSQHASYHIALMLSIAAGSLFASTASAGVTYAQTSTAIDGDVARGQGVGDSDTGQYGSISSVEHVYPNINGGYYAGEARAFAGTYNAFDLNAPTLLSLYVGAEAANSSVYSSRGTVAASSEYGDSFTVARTGDLNGYTIRFEYSVHALFQVSLTHQYNMGLRLMSGAYVPGVAFGGSDNAVAYRQTGIDTFEFDYGGWDYATMKPIVDMPRLFEFQGRTHFDLVIPANNNVVQGDLTVNLSAYTDMSVGYIGFNQSYVDALHTAGLTGVKVIDAQGNVTTPEALGWNLTFGSGMASPNVAPAAVPEPGTIVGLGVGIVGALGFARKRRGVRA